jgi:hypothetical protein
MTAFLLKQPHRTLFQPPQTLRRFSTRFCRTFVAFQFCADLLMHLNERWDVSINIARNDSPLRIRLRDREFGWLACLRTSSDETVCVVNPSHSNRQNSSVARRSQTRNLPGAIPIRMTLPQGEASTRIVWLSVNPQMQRRCPISI